MSEEQVVRNCAPTLAGLKTGNLFACPYENREDLLDFLRSLNRRLGKKGVRAVPLRIRQDKALIYLYRPARLEEDLSRASCEALLSEFGYNCRGGSRCLTRLARRLKQQEGFPPRDRPVSELSAGGREGLSGTQTLQMRGLLEGL